MRIKRPVSVRVYACRACEREELADALQDQITRGERSPRPSCSIGLATAGMADNSFAALTISSGVGLLHPLISAETGRYHDARILNAFMLGRTFHHLPAGGGAGRIP